MSNTWQIFGTAWESGELDNTSIYQPVVISSNIVLRAVRTWIISYNDPTYSSLTMKIYSNSSSDSPRKLLYTSTNLLLKSQIQTEPNRAAEIYFEFSDALLKGGDTYNFVVSGSGYVYSTNSHLAWMKAWPDPVYSGYTPTVENISTAPFALTLVGGEF